MDDAVRPLDVAESTLNTDDIIGNKRLYDAFGVPCDDAPHSSEMNRLKMSWDRS